MPRRLYLLELFAGTHSVSRALRRSRIARDFEIRLLSVDREQKFSPTIVADVNSWRYKDAIDEFLRGAKRRDMVAIWASPPCQEFSLAKNGRPRDLEAGTRTVKSALRIIKYVEANFPARSFWFVENPVGLLQYQAFMQKYNRYLNATCYCKFGFPIKKPTSIWSNVEDLALPMCNSQTPCKSRRLHGRHLITVQSGDAEHGGGLGGGEKAFPIPPQLIRHLFKKGIASHGPPDG